MKTAEELLDEWTDGEQNGMRPKRVQILRDDIMAVTDLTVPRRLGEIEGWLDAMRSSGTITKKLRKAVEGSDEDSDTEDTDE